MFRKLYEFVLKLSAHRLAVRYLAIIGFIESIIFPIPADIMLAPMCLKKPEKAYNYAKILSIASVLGGVFGYLIGYFFADFVTQIAANLGKAEKFASFKESFDEWGLLLVFIAGFSPFPYKIITISAGMLKISFPIFFIASAISRSLRFFLIAWAIKKGGAKLEKTISKYVEWLGWACVALVGVGIIYYISK